MSRLLTAINTLLCVAFSLPIYATPILLDNFFADTSVTLSANSVSAIIEESTNFPSTLLSNDPFLGDPEVIIASPDSLLTMDIEFLEGVNEDDEFRITLFNASDFSLLDEFFSDATINKVVEFELSDYIGTTLGLQFELRSFDNLFNSVVNINSVNIVSTIPTNIPEPPSLLLYFSFLAIMLTRLYKK